MASALSYALQAEPCCPAFYEVHGSNPLLCKVRFLNPAVSAYIECQLMCIALCLCALSAQREGAEVLETFAACLSLLVDTMPVESLTQKADMAAVSFSLLFGIDMGMGLDPLWAVRNVTTLGVWCECAAANAQMFAENLQPAKSNAGVASGRCLA